MSKVMGVGVFETPPVCACVVDEKNEPLMNTGRLLMVRTPDRSIVESPLLMSPTPLRNMVLAGFPISFTL